MLLLAHVVSKVSRNPQAGAVGLRYFRWCLLVANAPAGKRKKAEQFDDNTRVAAQYPLAGHFSHLAAALRELLPGFGHLFQAARAVYIPEEPARMHEIIFIWKIWRNNCSMLSRGWE